MFSFRLSIIVAATMLAVAPAWSESLNDLTFTLDYTAATGVAI